LKIGQWIVQKAACVVGFHLGGRGGVLNISLYKSQRAVSFIFFGVGVEILSVNPTSVIGVEFDLGERLYENQSKQTAI
jgi:hypothetical protein